MKEENKLADALVEISEETDYPQAMYSHIMQPFSDRALLGGKQSMKDIAKKEFEKYLIKKGGKVPRSGVPFKEFLSWLPVRKDNEDFFTIVHTMFFWSFNRLKLNIPDEITKHVLASEAPELIPAIILRRLPQWSQWIGFNLSFKDDLGVENATEVSHGAFVSFQKNEGREYLHVALQISDTAEEKISKENYMWIDFKIDLMQDRPIDATEFVQTKTNILSHLPNASEVIHRAKTHLIKTILFVASMEPAEHLQSDNAVPAPERKGKTYKFKPRFFPREVTVGEEYLSTIREFDETVKRSGGERKAHIRCAHWHRYWTGKKDNPKLILKWVAPCIVSGTSKEE